MTHRQPRILVGCDGSPESRSAVGWAADYAKATDGSVTLVNAWQWPAAQAEPVSFDGDDPRESSLALLDRLAGAVELPPDRVRLDVSRGSPAQVLLDLAPDADLLVVGSHGLGAFSRLLLGSVSARCATHAPCPVAVVRDDADARPRRRVVVGLDDSPGAMAALRWAMDYADLMRRPLSVVHAVEIAAPPIPFGYPVTFEMPRGQIHHRARAWLREMVAKAEADRGRPLRRPASFYVFEGNPGHVLVQQGHNASMVVVGRRGAGGFTRLVVGSVAAAVAHHATCTSVVTPPPVT